MPVAFAPTIQQVKFALKWTLAHTLYFTGLLHLWKQVALRHRAVVLTYHRVLPAEARDRTWSHPGIVVRNDTFEWQMQFLRRAFHLLTLSEFVAHLEERRPFPTASCLVTFDDGWLDTCTEAWPILSRHRVPAVVFLPVAFIGTGAMFWQEHLKRLLFETWGGARRDGAFRLAAQQVLYRHGCAHLLDTAEPDAREAIMEAVQSRKYDAGADAPIRDLESLLATHASVDQPRDAFMSWPMARQMAAAGVAFGGHGVTHRLLTAIPLQQVADEVVEARDVIGRELGAAPLAFAYPNGNCSASVTECVASAGYRVAFSTDPGPVSAADALHAVRRINVHEDACASVAMFMGRLVGLL